MKLTEKDKDFLEALRALADKKELSIELKQDGLKRLILRQNYGDKIEREFGMTRQGVRWRFQRLFTEIYSEAYVTIYAIESLFGTDLRHKAMEIAKERGSVAKKCSEIGQNKRLPSRNRHFKARFRYESIVKWVTLLSFAPQNQ